MFRKRSEKYELDQEKLKGLFKMFTRVPMESKNYNSCPTGMNLYQYGQDIPLTVVIQLGENPGSNKKVNFNFTFLVLSLLIVNLFFVMKMVGEAL